MLPFKCATPIPILSPFFVSFFIIKDHENSSFPRPKCLRYSIVITIQVYMYFLVTRVSSRYDYRELVALTDLFFQFQYAVSLVRRQHLYLLVT